ncbi:MAG: hypothetical protein PF517_12000 [Salinivirgaceae bacterium]|jgi:hypothetical protein|nr:hypothetical protein [Salinivirgaceae bacterium]
MSSIIKLYGQDDYVVGYGKLKIEWGNNLYTSISLFEDGKKIDFFKPEDNGKF